MISRVITIEKNNDFLLFRDVINVPPMGFGPIFQNHDPHVPFRSVVKISFAKNTLFNTITLKKESLETV